MAEFQDTLWRWISGILGVTCLSLIIILGILLNNTLHQKTIESTSPVETSTQFQEGPDCYFCQERWIGSRCNCYFVSTDLETWEISRKFCASNNSTLLQMDNRDELYFLRGTKNFYWIGVRYSKKHQDWEWINGSTFPQDVFPFLEKPNEENCITYSPSNTILDYSCNNKNRYVCKKQLK